MVEVRNELESQTHNTWDRWCHYPRRTLDFGLSSIEVSGRVEVTVLRTDFDTSSCSSKKDFRKERKKLILHDIYYVGNFLNIDNMQHGYRINNIGFFEKRALARINQYGKRIAERLSRNRVGLASR
jgi:hypothetical protein